nr:immunoglobulin heavy chain junction region [Macaca mulatta]MOW20869.1 immunoglobulin heavy chain junction region [Macaca mulatta]MOW22014.1 immunoglobulin heavy chain junction region [Macaca mulatta]
CAKDDYGNCIDYW